MSIYLIRHGETEGNRRRVVQLPEVPLNAAGRKQAVLLARRLRGEGIERILSSDLARARMTAEALGREIGVDVELEPLLRERDFGDLRGQAYASFDFDPMGPGYSPPSGESWECFHERASRAWRRVIEVRTLVGGGVAAVTHGLVCYSFCLHHLELPPSLGIPGRWGNTSLTVIDGRPPWRVSVLNSTGHLDGAAADDASGALA